MRDGSVRSARNAAQAHAKILFPMARADIDQLCVNTLRFLAADAVQQAKSGHPGLPMGAAPLAYVLWTQFLRHNPAQPRWFNRDRFILSGGHGSMLLYGLLHLTGYDLPLAELRNFRQWGSRTPGHPEAQLTPGVEVTTGPLGQGFANGIGMAIAEAQLAARFNRAGTPAVIDHHTYALVTDGDLMEGVASEAASLAGHLALGKLIYLYDDNQISIEGSTSLAFGEDRLARFAAYGWHVASVPDGNDLPAIAAALGAARAEHTRPSLIAVRTTIGYGAPNKQGTAAAHGEPLGEDELRAAKRNLGWPEEERFHIPDAVRAHMAAARDTGARLSAQWQLDVEQYAGKHASAAAELQRRIANELPAGWERSLPVFAPDAKGQATRSASGSVLNALAAAIPELSGGSADLAPSTKTLLKDGTDFGAGNYAGRNFHFGVREHAMGAVINGMALHGGMRAYGATFLVFYDYMRPPVRLAALSGTPAIFVFTHDSIGLGEDGPTHQPVEQLAGMRTVPNLLCLRPCDANETTEAWRAALQNSRGPSCLLLTRQDVPVLDRTQCAPASGLHKGAYVLRDAPGAAVQIILIASGSEVHIALQAQTLLATQNVGARVVSMPSWDLFARQPKSYRDEVLPPAINARISIEAGVTFGWERWVGSAGIAMGIDHFGASAPYQTLYEKFGLTAEHVVENANRLMAGTGKA